MPIDQNIQSFGMIAVMIAIAYFMIIRPNKKRQKEHEATINAVKKGDKVVMASGIHGSVYDLDDKTVTLTVASNVQIKFDKSAITSVESK